LWNNTCEGEVFVSEGGNIMNDLDEIKIENLIYEVNGVKAIWLNFIMYKQKG